MSATIWRRPPRALLPWATFVALLTGCADSTVPQPLVLRVVDGDAQEGQLASALPKALVVEVTGLDGVPRANVRVSWSATGGGLVGGTARTNAAGLATASWTLGPSTGSQSATITVPGTTAEFRAWATPPPPTNWVDAVEIQPAPVLEGESLLGQVRVWSTWPGTVRLKTPDSCFLSWEYPSLHDSSGERLAHRTTGCLARTTYHSIPPGDTLVVDSQVGIQGVGPGEYTLRYRFAVVEINGVPASLPAVHVPLTIGGG